MEDFLGQLLADPAVTTFGMAVALAALALWVAAAWWSYSDASRRAENSLAGYIAAGWVILSTPLLLPLSLAVYAFARPPVAAAERRVATLARELEATVPDHRCSTCGMLTEAAWLRCPACASWLASPCATCDRWSDATLEACPWCGDEERARPYVADLTPEPRLVIPPARRIAVIEPVYELDAAGNPIDADLPADDEVEAPGIAAAVAADADRRPPHLTWRPDATTPDVGRAPRHGPALLPEAARLGRARLGRA